MKATRPRCWEIGAKAQCDSAPLRRKFHMSPVTAPLRRGSSSSTSASVAGTAIAICRAVGK
jgi:hypothetical protein